MLPDSNEMKRNEVLFCYVGADGWAAASNRGTSAEQHGYDNVFFVSTTKYQLRLAVAIQAQQSHRTLRAMDGW